MLMINDILDVEVVVSLLLELFKSCMKVSVLIRSNKNAISWGQAKDFFDSVYHRTKQYRRIAMRCATKSGTL